MISAIALAGTAMASPFALAADISNPVQTLGLEGGTANFGATFPDFNKNATFADRFTFSTVARNAVDALVSSIGRNAAQGVDITGFALYDSNDALVADGMQEQTGRTDLWSLSVASLAAGSYYVRVSGSLVSNRSGSYGANVNLIAIPEPETYGMMIAGLGILGLLSRRRKAANAAHAA